LAKIDSFLLEQNIISILLKEPQRIYKVASQIRPDYFSDNPNRKQNKAIFMIMDYISRKKDVEELEFDSITILSVANKHDNLNKAIKSIFSKKEDFIQYIETLREAPIDPSNIDIHIEELKKVNITNDLYYNLNSFQEELLDGYQEWGQEEIIDKAESSILEISNRYNADEDRLFISANKNRLERYKKKKPNKNGFAGLPLHLNTVNKFSRGLLKEGSVTILNAQTGVGKSMFLKNVAKFLAIDNNIPVYLGANEQNIEEQEERIIQEITGLPTIIIENNLYNSDKETIEIDGNVYKTEKCREKVYQAVQQIEEAPLYFDKISGYTAGSLVQRAKYFKKRHNIQLFIWDYVKESTATSIEDGHLRHWLANIVRSLKEDVADRLGISVLTASQAKTYEFWMSAESYGIEKFCTGFCLLRQLDSKERRPFDGEYAFTIKKNRYGKEHTDYKNQWISLDFDEKYLKFEETPQ